MKPAWDALMEEYADHATILIADVDCTAGGQSKCNDVGVRGYPTIKYGDPNNLEDYEGGRDEAALSAFAQDLKPACGPGNKDACTADQLARIDELLAMDAGELDGLVQEKEKELKLNEKKFSKRVEKLQAKYKEFQEEKDAADKAIKESGLGLMKSVRAFVKSGAEL